MISNGGAPAAAAARIARRLADLDEEEEEEEEDLGEKEKWEEGCWSPLLLRMWIWTLGLRIEEEEGREKCPPEVSPTCSIERAEEEGEEEEGRSKVRPPPVLLICCCACCCACFSFPAEFPILPSCCSRCFCALADAVSEEEEGIAAGPRAAALAALAPEDATAVLAWPALAAAVAMRYSTRACVARCRIVAEGLLPFSVLACPSVLLLACLCLAHVRPPFRIDITTMIRSMIGWKASLLGWGAEVHVVCRVSADHS